MLIVSKKKDFYDSIGEQYGIDKSIVYRREEIEIKEKEKINGIIDKGLKDLSIDRLDLNFPRHTKYKTFLKWYLVGFCGSGYIGLEVTYEKAIPAEYPKSAEDLTVYYYGEELISLLENAAALPRKKNKYRNDYNEYENTIKQIKAIQSIDYHEFFFGKKIPIFLYILKGYHMESFYTPDENKLILNPLLKEYQFFKVKTAPQAFQEIQQFISGVLGTDENDMVVTEDKYKILAAGMDLKTSFRKEPGKPKPRKLKS